MIEILFLADCPEEIPTLAAWFRAQWPDYYVARTQAEVEIDFQKEAQHHGLPVRLVALVDGELAGTIVLRGLASPTLPASQPGLGGLFVLERFRARGIGSQLVRGGMNVARDLGFEVVYATTAVAGGILERLGWLAVDSVAGLLDEELTLYRCELSARPVTECSDPS